MNNLAHDVRPQESNALAPFPFDVSSVLYDANSAFNPLHNECLLDYQVADLRDGFVLVSIAMPEGMTKVFATMLESLSGFFRVLDRRSKSVAAEQRAYRQATCLDELERRQRLKDDFAILVLNLFDQFRASGLNANEAVRRTNLALKEQNHPWANHHTVLGVIRASGRLRTKRGVKKNLASTGG